MSELVSDERFLELIRQKREQPLDERKSRFYKIAGYFKAGRIPFDEVLVLSAVYGGKEAEAWLRDAIPLCTQYKEFEEFRESILTKKTKDTPKVTATITALK